MLLLAAGQRHPPVFSILKTLLETDAGVSRVTLVYGNRQSGTSCSRAIEGLTRSVLTVFNLHADRRGCRAPICSGRLDSAKVADLFAGALGAAAFDGVYICGPGG